MTEPLVILERRNIGNIIIIGGGVIGCSIAYELSQDYEDVFLLEALDAPGKVIAEHSSGVAHAGIYYAPGSLKARTCIRGKRLLETFCTHYKVPYLKLGKVIVATNDEEVKKLQELETRAKANGAHVSIIPERDLRRIESNAIGKAALLSPGTAVFDQSVFTRTLATLAQENDASILYNTRVTNIIPGEELIIQTNTRGSLDARVLINCAGLNADEISSLIGNTRYKIHPCRGEYYWINDNKTSHVFGLVYPVPQGPGLGIHITKTVDRKLLAGPNAKYVNEKDDYDKTPWDTPEMFAESLSRIVNGIEPKDLKPAYSGIRPKLTPKGSKEIADFVIEFDPVHENILHLLGIESPGLTSSLAIAELVSSMIRERFS